MELMSLGLILVVVVAAWWFFSVTREKVLLVAKQHCQKRGVQFLDGSVVREKLALAKTANGSTVIEQCFRFEFASTGEQRYNGKVYVQGSRVTKVALEPFKVDPETEQQWLH